MGIKGTLKKVLGGMGIELAGCTRVVITCGRVVIKVPKPRYWKHFLSGLLANMGERDTWRWNSGPFESGKSHLLCPVLWASWGGWLLVMRRVDRVLDWDEDHTDVTEHMRYFPGDDKVRNYGMLDGRVVKIDYGQLDVVIYVQGEVQQPGEVLI